MVNQRELRERWTPERAADAKEALENWKKKKAIEQVAFGQHEGRWDLRGLPIYTNVGGVTTKHVEASGVERDYTFVTLDSPPEFHNVKWESVDFSYADVNHLRLFLSEIRDCLFAGGTFRDWRNWGVRYIDCDFSGADLQNSNIGGAPHKRKDVEYVNCVWRKGNLKSAHLSDGRYLNCRFENVSIAKEQITNASFIRCSVSGRVTEVIFDGRDLKSERRERPWSVRPDALVECDLSECALRDVRFLGIDMRAIRLPNQGQRIPHFPIVARRAYEWASTADLSPNDARFLQMYWQGHITSLADDGEGWIDLSLFDGPARELIEASMGSESVT